MEKGQARYREALRAINDTPPQVRRQVCVRLAELVSNPAWLTAEEYVHPIIAHYHIVIWVLTPLFTAGTRVCK